MIRTVLAALLTLTVGAAMAQHHAPYAGMERRDIRSLSDQEIADLRAGRGMGLALAAELNGFPGPLHALELGRQLGLSDDQRRRVEEQFAAMRAEVVPIGERLIAQEAHLNRLFATRAVTPASLAALTAEIGATQAALRAAHLRYHLTMSDVLTPAQVARYAELRGYAGAVPSPAHGTHHPAGPR